MGRVRRPLGVEDAADAQTVNVVQADEVETKLRELGGEVVGLLLLWERWHVDQVHPPEAGARAVREREVPIRSARQEPVFPGGRFDGRELGDCRGERPGDRERVPVGRVCLRGVGDLCGFAGQQLSCEQTRDAGGAALQPNACDGGSRGPRCRCPDRADTRGPASVEAKQDALREPALDRARADLPPVERERPCRGAVGVGPGHHQRDAGGGSRARLVGGALGEGQAQGGGRSADLEVHEKREVRSTGSAKAHCVGRRRWSGEQVAVHQSGEVQRPRRHERDESKGEDGDHRHKPTPARAWSNRRGTTRGRRGWDTS